VILELKAKQISVPLISLTVSIDFQPPKYDAPGLGCDYIVLSKGPPTPDWLVSKTSYF